MMACVYILFSSQTIIFTYHFHFTPVDITTQFNPNHLSLGAQGCQHSQSRRHHHHINIQSLASDWSIPITWSSRHLFSVNQRQISKTVELNVNGVSSQFSDWWSQNREWTGRRWITSDRVCNEFSFLSADQFPKHVSQSVVLACKHKF